MHCGQKVARCGRVNDIPDAVSDASLRQSLWKKSATLVKQVLCMPPAGTVFFRCRRVNMQYLRLDPSSPGVAYFVSLFGRQYSSQLDSSKEETSGTASTTTTGRPRRAWVDPGGGYDDLGDTSGDMDNMDDLHNRVETDDDEDDFME